MLALVFQLSIALIAFTYLGYPLLMAAWARVAPKPPRRGAHAPPVTIVIVAHDAAGAIVGKVRSCLDQRYPSDHLRVLVVSDGSTDDTAALAHGAGDARVQVLAFSARRGKAACLNDAIAACTTEVAVLTDVRQPLDPDAVACLLENFADPTVGAVGGELVLRTDGATGFGEAIDAYWRYEKFIRRQESLVASTVGVSGALYALRRSLWQPIPASTILDDVLIPMNVVMQGRRVVFDPRALAWDRPSASADQERLRKVRTLAGNFQLLALRPAWLLPWRNPLFLQLFCHKVLRLLVPVCMALALLSNLALAPASAAWTLLLAVQLTAYALAVAGAAMTSLRRWTLIRLLTTFLLLNTFVVLGFVDFLSNKNAHLWRSHRTPA